MVLLRRGVFPWIFGFVDVLKFELTGTPATTTVEHELEH